MRPFVRLALIALTFHAGQVAAQQELAFVERGPQFLLAANGSPERIEASRVPILRQRISLDLRDVSMHDAITAISRQSGLQLMFSEKILSHDRTVTLRAEAITVAAALTEVLLDAEVDVLFSRSGNAALVRRSASAIAVVGSIAGRITDASTQQGVEGVRVSLEGTRWSTRTRSTGNYRLGGVAAGGYTLVMRRLGYKESNQAVTVEDGREVTVNVTLEAVPSALDEVVMTVTGEQRLLELGHVVGRINADSVVKAAPVSSLSELLNGRVPGLQVHTYQGTVGGQVSLRVRSPNTMQLGTEPIVIVDGIRYTSNPADRIGLNSINGVEPSNPLNDLNPNEIESIEVVKGPSAATLYGTDAANGVIVVTTKRGRPGPARWNAYVKGATTAIPAGQHPDRYLGWGTVFGSPNIPECRLDWLAARLCTQQDSVSVLPNPLNDPQLTIFGSKPRWEYGMNVSGGSQNLRYFVAGDVEEATGPLRLPPVMADSISQTREVTQEQLEPNAFSKVNVRTNVTVGVGRAAEVLATAGYSRRATRTFGSGFLNPYLSSYGNASPTDPYGRGAGPDDYFSQTSTERVSRSFASVTARWSPSAWLLTRATAGMDLSSITRSSLARRGESSRAFNGAVGDDRGRQAATTGELAATASFSRGRLTSRTSIGGQYVRTLDDVLGSAGTDLPPGGSSIGEAASVRARQNYREQVTLGSYLEQQVALNQRLFLTGALRVDGASTFGRDYHAAVYPKAGVSWLVSDEPRLTRLPLVDELRLRYAFGASGQQPRPEWARTGYVLLQRFVGGAVSNVYTVSNLGNPLLRPERVREHEFGFDATAVRSRVEVGLTWFRRRAVDQILNVTLPPGLATMQTNLGATSGRGFEAQIAARLLDTRAASWHIMLQHSSHTTTLVELGDAPERRSQFGGYVEGYPIGARFMRPLVGFEDANGDGIITTAEIQRGDTAVYHGVSTPPRSQTVTTTVTLMDRRLRLSALLERRSGYTQMNRPATELCQRGLCRGIVDPSAPLAEQAEAAAFAQGGYVRLESGDFTRLREMSVGIDLPTGVTRPLRLGTAMLTLQGRNLAMWTSYSGADPESADLGTLSGQELGIPQGRSWALRFDVGF